MVSIVNAGSSQQAWCQGRIPLYLRVGVTGHRFIDQHDDALMAAVGEALDRIERHCRKGTAATPVNLAVVSALAEGADRIVARAAIGRGAILEVVLPLPLDDYLTDFESEKSRSEFCSLVVDHASAITELPAAGARDAAYERAGQAIVDRSDVLLALWDGRAARGRGGTAEIVSYARRRGVPILQVTVERLDPGSPRPRTVHEPELPARFCLLSSTAFEQLDRYNSGSPRAGRGSSQPSLLPSNLDVPIPPYVQSIVNYAQPYFDRAERMARHAQRMFIWLTRLLYSLAAGAVILVATQVIFFGHDPQIVWAEVVALATVVVALVAGKRAGFIWGYCSVVIPAVGAAIAGYSAQREYARIAERSRQMVVRLQDLREQVEHSHRLSSLQRAARHTEVLMRTDTAEWYEVVRLHDLEVPAG